MRMMARPPIALRESGKSLRIAGALLGCLGAFGALMTGISGSLPSFEDEWVVGGLLLVCCATSAIGILAAGTSTRRGLLVCALVSYIFVAYPMQFTLILRSPEQYSTAAMLFGERATISGVTEAFFMAVPAILLVLLGAIVADRTLQRSHAQTPVCGALRHARICAVLLLLILGRYIAQTLLDIGVPGVIPKSIGVPYVIGVIELLTRPALLLVLNYYFVAAVIARSRVGTLLALVLIATNIFLGLRVGYKSDLVYQAIFLLWFAWRARKGRLGGIENFPIGLLATLLLAAVMVVYPVVNEYRFARLGGEDISSALATAIDRSEKANTSPIQQILSRVNGVDVFFAATRLANERELDATSLGGSHATDLIKKRLYGFDADAAVTQFGTTVFSVLFLMGGMTLLMLGSLAIGATFVMFFQFAERRLLKSGGAREAFAPAYAVLCVKVLSAGGQYDLYIKEASISIAALMILAGSGFVSRKVTAKR